MRLLAKLSSRLLPLTLAVLGVVRPASALAPDELALICNTRVPGSVELAQWYAQARGVPSGRIIELTLPDSEQMSADLLDPDVIAPVRKALTDRHLQSKVKCLVTFYGVPLKLTPRHNRPEEALELKQLKAEHDQINQRITQVVTSLEAAVIKCDPSFRPSAAVDIPQMLKRADAAMICGKNLLPALSSAQDRQTLTTAIVNTIAELAGSDGLVRNVRPELLPSLTTRPATGPITQPYSRWQEIREAADAAKEKAKALSLRRWESASRKELRELVAEHLGLVESMRLLEAQIDYLSPDETTALDSELAMLWIAQYPRRSFLENPLNFRNKNRAASPALMISRLDGPQSGTGREIVSASMKVETSGGLKGTVVVDSRGLSPVNGKGQPDGFGAFDQLLRDLARTISHDTSLPLVADDGPDVFRPATKIVNNVALYCGWYSVRAYVPAFKFVPGAVAFHVASFEMISLRDPNEHGWCRGLLNDGVAATIGPVDEPYLMAFPNPEEFFPLLLCGKYTLAEAYWLTQPLVSWKMVLIGDPLYNPFKANPALPANKLPEPMRQFVSPPSLPTLQSEHLPMISD